MNLRAPLLAALLLGTPALAHAGTDGGAALLADGGAVLARPESFTSEALPDHVELGKPFTCKVSITHPAGEVYALAATPELGDFDLVGHEKADAKGAGDKVVTTFTLTLEPWALGEKAVPDLTFEVQTPAGPTRMAVPGPFVTITGVLDPDGGADTPLRDISPPVEMPVRTYRVFAWIAGVLAAFALGRWLLERSRRPKAEKPIVAVYVPPEQSARESLHALMAEDLPGQGRQREFHFRLSEITRRYLGLRFGFDALDLTTPELLSALRVRSTPGLDLRRFEAMCTESDLCKFARLQPEPSACKEQLQATLSLVEATTLVSLPGPQPGGPK